MPLIDRVYRIPPIRTFFLVMHVYGTAGGGVLASGVAARALYALLPALLLTVALVGFIVRDPSIQARLVLVISDFVPPVQDLLTQTLRIVIDGALPSSIIGLLLLIWAAGGFFQTLDVAFAVILEEGPRRNPVSRGLIGLGTVLLILVSLGVVVTAGLFAWSLAERFIGSFLDPSLLQLLVPVVVAGVTGLALLLAFRFLPLERPSWRAAVVPAIGAGIAFAVLTEVFTFLAPYLAGTASLYGTIAAIFVLLTWLQFSAQVVLLGVAWVKIRAFGAPPLDEVPWPTGEQGRPGGTSEVPPDQL